MTLPANIRANISVPFPARVQGEGFVTVSKANGLWTIGVDLSTLAAVTLPNATQYLLLYDAASNAYSLILANALAELASSYRAVTASGNIVTQPTDGTILINNTSGGPISIILPTSASQNGLPITVKDIGGNAHAYPITFVPASMETIDGFSASAAAANGVALIDINYGRKTVTPLISGGWYL